MYTHSSAHSAWQRWQQVMEEEYRSLLTVSKKYVKETYTLLGSAVDVSAANFRSMKSSGLKMVI